jgi:DNA-3-methyladenine glycosylase I
MYNNSITVRCAWPKSHPLYIDYHDKEWGVPEFDSRALWEKLILDGFQAGLSWITILKKRESFNHAFAQFNPEVVARFSDDDIEELMQNEKIIRSRSKIKNAIKSARIYLDLQQSGLSFHDLIWSIQDHKPIINHFESSDEIPSQTKTSQELAKILKSKGFGFCGPVITYAFMQAVGMVNDHLVTCFRHKEVCELSINNKQSF